MNLIEPRCSLIKNVSQSQSIEGFAQNINPKWVQFVDQKVKINCEHKQTSGETDYAMLNLRLVQIT